MTAATEIGWEKQFVDDDLIVSAAPCVLHGVTLNGVTTVGDVSIYDGTDATGELIATYNIRSAVSVSYQGIGWLYDCKMATGIFVDIGSSTFAGNLTVTYR